MNYNEIHNLKKENKRLKLVIYDLQRKHLQEIKRLKREIIQPRVDISKNEHKWQDVMRAVCQVYDLTPDEIQSQCRKQDIVFARHMFCYICRKHLSQSLSSIGRILLRDHSTIINSVSKASDLIEFDRITKQRHELTMDILHRYLYEKGNSLYTLVEYRGGSTTSQEEI